MNNRSNASSGRAVGLLVFCAAVVLAKSFLFPYSVDNAIFAYMAKILLSGGEPYVASWDQNFPGIVIFHLLHLVPFGTSVTGLHIVDSLFQLVLAIMVYRLVSSVGNQGAGLIAGLCVVIYYVHQGINISAERDTLVSTLIISSLALSLAHPRIVLSGLLVGLAILVRPTYAIVLLPLCWWLNREHKAGVKGIATLTATAALPIFLVIVWYALRGTFDAFFEATVLYNLEVYNQSAGLAGLGQHLQPYWPVFIGLIPGVWVLWRTPLGKVLVFLALAFCLNAMVLSGLAYQYHPVVVMLILISVIGWCAMIDRLSVRPGRVRYALYLGFIVIVLSSSFRGAFAFRTYYNLATGQTYLEHERGNIYGGYREEVRTIAHIRRTTTASDRVQIFAGPISIPLLADRLPSSRFITTHALMMRNTSGILQPFQERWRSEYLQDLLTRPPRLFLLSNEPAPAWRWFSGRAGRAILDSDFVELAALIDRDYRLDTIIGRITIYRKH